MRVNCFGQRVPDIHLPEPEPDDYESEEDYDEAYAEWEQKYQDAVGEAYERDFDQMRDEAMEDW